MRIALHVDGPIIRGNEHQVISLAAGLRARGHDVFASCRSGGPVEGALREHDVRTTGIRPRGNADIFSTVRFALWLRRTSPDALLLTSWVRLVNGARAASIAGVPRVVFRLGGLQPVGHRRRQAERNAIAHRVHAVIANSGLVAASVTDPLPSVADRVVVVHNGLALPDNASASSPGGLAPALRSLLRVPDDALTAVAVSGLEDNKGFDVLIRATADVAGVHVILVGGGTPQQEQAMRALAAEAGVAGRVHFLGRRNDIDAILRSCDFFVMPSRSEGFSVARLEAMAARIPIIATDTGGSAEATAPWNGRPAAGWVVPPGDVRMLSHAMQFVRDAIRRDDPVVQQSIDEAAWRVHNMFTMTRMIDGYEAVLSGSLPAAKGLA